MSINTTYEEFDLTSYKTQPKVYISDLSEALAPGRVKISGAIQYTGEHARPTRAESRYLRESEE